MGMDVDYIAGKQAIEELEELFSNQEHGEREKIADDIIEFVKNMKVKYDNKHALTKLNNEIIESDIIQQTQLEQAIKTRTTIFQIFKSGDDISVPLIQRKCKVGYNSAFRVFENLIEDGLIERGNGVSKFV